MWWFSDSVGQWINESMNQVINGSTIHESMSRMDRWFNDSMRHWVNEATNQKWMDEWVNEWMNEWMNEWLNEWMIEWMIEWMNEWLNEGRKEGKKEWRKVGRKEGMKQWIIESLNQWELSLRSHEVFAGPILQKCSEHARFFSILKCKPSSPYILVHILPTSSSKSAPRTSQCVTIFRCKPSSRYSPVRFLAALSSKSAPRPSLFNIFELQIELSLQSCALFVDSFEQIEPRARGNRDPVPLYPKKQ